MAFTFDLMDLRLFAKVAETENLTKGADALHISLPAASTRIKNLEQGLGVDLLWRNQKGVSLTPAGQTLAYHVRLMLGQLQQLQGDLNQFGDGVKGHLRLLANTTASAEYLPDVLGVYLRHHPGVTVDLKERLSRDIVRAVTDGHADIGIVAGDVRTGNLETIPYRNDRLVLVTPAGHPLAQRASVSFEETLDFQHINLGEASALQAFLRSAADAVSRSIPLRIQVGNFETACRMIEADVGLGILPESASQRYLRNLRISIVPLTDAWARRSMLICFRSFAGLPQFARDLIDLLLEDARRGEDLAKDADIAQ